MRGMTFLMRAVTSLLVVCFPLAATAAPCSRVVRVQSPCTGDLLPIAISAKALNCLKTCNKKCEEKLASNKKVYNLKISGLEKLLETEKEKSARLSKLLDRALDKTKPADPPFWGRKELWGAVGFTAGMGLAVGMFFLMQKQ